MQARDQKKGREIGRLVLAAGELSVGRTVIKRIHTSHVLRVHQVFFYNFFEICWLNMLLKLLLRRFKIVMGHLCSI
jgi:hypothetical protein